MSLNKDQLAKQAIAASSKLLNEKGYVSPVDVLLETGKLSRKDYEDWRNKKIPYLERVITGNLGKINTILRTIQKYSQENKLKPSKTSYKSWGSGSKVTLRFSKTGDNNVEEAYSTHYVRPKETE